MISKQGGGESEPGALQFDQVELKSEAPRSCARCRRPIAHEYFETRGAMLCRQCAEALGGGAPDPVTFLRALALGAGAALLGTVVWFAIIEFWHSEVGLVALGVGIAVGAAVRKGSGGRGGTRYQAVAMALTYLSITSSYLLLLLEGGGERLGLSLGTMVVIALTHPFSLKNAIGLFIMGIALYQAWKINRAVPIAGPFRIAQPPAAAA
ncbi:MAG TPA: hypothetical protein VGM29_17820 [Polyangiaceae bacterium]|jgi:hypothetical protein